MSIQTFHDVCTRSVVKFFVEYLDLRAMPRVLSALFAAAFPVPTLPRPIPILTAHQANVQIDWKSCQLLIADRDTLFAQCPVAEKEGFRSCMQRNTAPMPNPTEHADFLSRAILPDAPAAGPSYFEAEGHASLERQGYDIDLAKIEMGMDERTTCMVRNIPNKYTQVLPPSPPLPPSQLPRLQQMLIDMIDETHYGAYDFVYLRMDFKNKCNVGYAFINFIDPKLSCAGYHTLTFRKIVGFAKRILGKKWPRFNSDKVCHLSYARIQGKEALIDKFRHSK